MSRVVSLAPLDSSFRWKYACVLFFADHKSAKRLQGLLNESGSVFCYDRRNYRK